MSSRPRTTSASTGFTLVELLVVIGIIALLISILLPTLGRARERSNQVKCLSNIRQIGMAMYQYTQDNHGYFPRAARGPGDSRAGQYRGNYEDWVYWQQPNLPGQPTSFFWPPTGTRPPDQSPERGPIAHYLGRGFNKALFICPSDSPDDHKGIGAALGGLRYPYSYTMNDLLSFDLRDYDPGSSDYFGGRPAKVSSIRRSAEVVMLLEESAASINDGDTTIVGIVPGSSAADPKWNITAGGQGGGSDWLSLVHDRGIRQPVNTFVAGKDKENIPNSAGQGNVSFCDGHAGTVTREYLHSPTQKHWSWVIK